MVYGRHRLTQQEISAREDAHYSVESVCLLPNGRLVLGQAEVRPQAIDDGIALSDVNLVFCTGWR